MTSLKHIWRNNPSLIQVSFVCLSILISTWIGIHYATEAFIGYLPILLWLFSVFLCFAALYSEKQPALFQIKLNHTWAGIFALITIALLIRFINLSSLPKGFHPDEAGYIEFAVLHIPKEDDPYLTINPFRTGLDSQPILYKYILRFSTYFFGMNIPASKISSVAIGTLAVASVFLMMNELAGRRMAWITSILMATYHYHVHWSRIALSNIWVTLLVPLTLGLFLLGWRKNNDKGAIFAGLALGLSAYIYSGGYFVIFLLIFIFMQEWINTNNRFDLMKYTAKMLCLAFVVAAPLIVFAIRVPDFFFDRASVVNGWKAELIQPSFYEYLFSQLKKSFGAYNFYPEVTGFYAPNAPFLIAFASILFLIGIFFAIKQKKLFLLFWIFIVTILGGVMLNGTPASTHFIGVIPAICWVVAIPLDKLIEHGHIKWFYTFLALIIFMDLFFYFFIYPSYPDSHLNVPFPIILR
ncbi:MAG: glycosyltransferase family 39 protein [Anaerolineales bacterium]|nr:glycosyltransferase family 39 protein [Anaerolineales bacterium]